jgi:hypothetical protein
MTMHDELPIINFSTKKYVDASTLSRIRSHAQQRVQDQRLARRNKNEDDSSLNAAKTSRDVVSRGERAAQQSFTFVFEPTSGRKTTTAATANTSAKRRKRPAKRSAIPVAEDSETVKRESHSLSASPGERVDPFASFPVTVDREFMELAEGYLLGWKWRMSCASIFRMPDTDRHMYSTSESSSLSRNVVHTRTCSQLSRHRPSHLPKRRVEVHVP